MAVNKMKLINPVMFLSVCVIMLLAGCSANAEENLAADAAVNGFSSPGRTIAIDKLEIYHFHGTSQCYSCVTVGDYAEATVNTYFADELKSGKIVFGHINGDLPANRDLVIKYGVTGSSLWLGTYDGENFAPEQNVQVWYKINDKQAYMDYLKGVIEQKLAGN